MKRHLKTLGFVLLYTGVYWIINIFVAVILVIALFVGMLHGRMPGTDLNEVLKAAGEAVDTQANLMLIIANTVSLLLFWFIFKLRRLSMINVCSFRKVNSKAVFIFTLIGVTANVVVGYAMPYLLKVPFYAKRYPEYEKMMQGITAGNPIIGMIAVCLMAPFFEEILMRGMVYNQLRNSLPVYSAVILQGIIFGIYHLNWIQGTYAAVLGILLGLVYVWTGSIWSSIIVHMAFNSSNLFMSSIMSDSIHSLYDVALLGVSAAVLTLCMLFLWRGRRGSVKFPVEFPIS